MDRRTLLGLAGTLCVALAGCAGDGGSGDSDTPSPTPTLTETPERPAIETATLTVQDITGGQQVDEATVSLEGGAVVVDGTVWGSDGCKTAVLETADYEVGSETLRVAVATADREDAGDVCTEAIVEIDYRLRVAFSGGFPGTVAVTHDGRAVTTVDTDGS